MIKQIKYIMYEVIPGFVPSQVIRDKIVENYESKTVLENQKKIERDNTILFMFVLLFVKMCLLLQEQKDIDKDYTQTWKQK